MRFDSTAIVISQRKGDELFDLSLLVMRRYWKDIAVFSLIGILPFALLNAYLLYPITQYDRLLIASHDLASANAYAYRYMFVMAGIVFLQSPLALSPLTYFLGQAVFIERPSIRQVFGVLASRWFPLLLVVGLLRFALVSIGIAVWYSQVQIFRPEIELVLFCFFIIGVIYLIRAFRPFAPEILLLERCPLYASKKSNDLSYGKRSYRLHTQGGDLFSSHVMLTLVAIFFVIVTSCGIIFCVGVVIGIWKWGWWIDMIGFPLVVWAMAIWGTVIRFLLYLNTRIRTEGWEVELKLKAEAHRLSETQPA